VGVLISVLSGEMYSRTLGEGERTRTRSSVFTATSCSSGGAWTGDGSIVPRRGDGDREEEAVSRVVRVFVMRSAAARCLLPSVSVNLCCAVNASCKVYYTKNN